MCIRDRDNLTSISGYGSVFARSLLLALIATVICLVIAVSYTHLDVYKRQWLPSS